MPKAPSSQESKLRELMTQVPTEMLFDEIERRYRLFEQARERLAAIVSSLSGYVAPVPIVDRAPPSERGKRETKPARKQGKKRRAKRKRASGRKTTNAYILEALTAFGRPATTNEVLEALQKAGWQTTGHYPRTVIYTALTRLADVGEVRRGADGTFAIAASPS